MFYLLVNLLYRRLAFDLRGFIKGWSYDHNCTPLDCLNFPLLAVVAVETGDRSVFLSLSYLECWLIAARSHFLFMGTISKQWRLEANQTNGSWLFKNSAGAE